MMNSHFNIAKKILYKLRMEYKMNEKELENNLEKIIYQPKLKNKIKKIGWPTIKTADAYELAEFTPSYRIKEKEIMFLDEKVTLSINWSMYKEILIRSNKEHLISKYSIEDRFQDYKMIKELSTYMLQLGPKADKDFYFMVGLDQLYGYDITPLDEDQTESIANWVNNHFKPKIEDSEAEYLIQFRTAVKKVLLSSKKENLLVTTTAEQYCRDITLTGTTGSAFDPGGKRLTGKYRGEAIKVDNNKFSKSAVLSVENKMERLLTYQDQKAKVNLKVENYPKKRLIVSSDYNTTLKMRFVDTWLGKWMKGSNYSTLWMTKKQLLEMWRSFAKQGDWNVPIDQSAFDHHVSIEMIEVMNEEILGLIKERALGNNSELIQVMQTIIDELKNTKIYYETPDKRKEQFELRSGVISGWQWTAFYDTLANIAESIVALENNKKALGKEPTLINFNAQGDDQYTKFRRLSDALLYWFELSDSGFDIHPTKNFFSKEHNEYLRRYSTKDGINGYPARMINKIMWLYPGKQERLDKREKINNIIARWTKLKNRLRLGWEKVIGYLKKDLQGAKVSKLDQKVFLSGKWANGGAQIIKPYNNIVLERMGGDVKHGIKLDDIGYQQFKENFGQWQEREIDEWLLKVTGILNNNSYLKEEDIDFYNEAKEFEPLEFTYIKNSQDIHKEQMIAGWQLSDIFGSNTKLVEKVFPNVKNFVLHSNVPKGWYYDYITGRIKIPLPETDLINKEAVSLIFTEYKNAMLSAMFKKRRKRERWGGLVEYNIRALLGVIGSDIVNPKMFCL